jgi:hypothetical protein
MATSGQPGPISVVGLTPPMQGPTPYVGGPAALGIPDNPDFGPSLFWAGVGVRDPQYMPRIGAGPLSAVGYANQDVGFLTTGPLIDQVPATAGTAKIAALANAASGVAMTLAAASTGITVLAAPLTILPTGNVVPTGCLVIDGNPNWIGAGISDAFQFFDPTKAISRALSVTGSTSGTGGNIDIVGYDIYGWRMTQRVAATAGATTVNTLKAFKFVQSVTPAFTDAHAYSIGTTDIIGLPLRADRFAYIDVTYSTGSSRVVADTGFVAAVTTSPATNLTGDVRGTYLLPSASDGTKVLTLFIAPSVGNLVLPATYAAFRAGMLGVSQV